MTTPKEARELLTNHAQDLRKEIRRDARPVPSGYSREKEFVAAAIEKFLSGEAKSLDAAFGVKLGRGAPTRHAKHMDIARPIYSLMRQGRSWSEILNEIDVKAHGDDSTARRALKECLTELMAEEIAARIDELWAEDLVARLDGSNSPD